MRSVGGKIGWNDLSYILLPVNVLGVMGKGMAKAYKDYDPYGFEFYKKCCEDLSIVTTLCLVDNVIFLPTKTHWKYPSNATFITDQLHRVILQFWINFGNDRENPTKFSLPKVGCGEGGLDWENDVRPILIPVIERLERFTGYEFLVYEGEGF